jgi:hypothetical protein
MDDPLPIPDLKGDDADVAARIFEFVRFLLDDDGNLTPSGNLNAAGRNLLRARLGELLEPRAAASLDDGVAPDAGLEPEGAAGASAGATP